MTLLKDINPGPGTAQVYPNDAVQLGGKLYFPAGATRADVALWETDGTPAGTHPANAGGMQVTPSQLTVMGGKLYSVGYRADVGGALFVFDPATATTTLVKDINPNSTGPSIGNPSGFGNRTLVASGDKLFLSGHPGDGAEPWVSDGTGAGTVPLKNINVNNNEGSSPNGFVAIPGGVVFTAYTGTVNNQGVEPFVSDGTPDTTNALSGPHTRIISINPGAEASDPDGYTRLGAGVVFSASGSGYGTIDAGMGHYGKDHELYRISSVGAVGADLVKDIYPGVDNDMNPHQGLPLDIAPFGPDKVVFKATESTNGLEFWVSDGTDPGTFPISQVGVGSLSANPTTGPAFAALGAIFVGAGQGVDSDGSELYRSDGTTSSAREVVDAQPGMEGSSPQDFVAVGDQILYVGNTGATGVELWASDGTAAGTRRLPEVNPGPGDGTIGANQTGGPFLGVLGKNVILVGDNGSTGFELYSVSFDAPVVPPGPTTTPPGPTPAPTTTPTTTTKPVGSSTTARARKKYLATLARKKKISVTVAVTAAGVLPSGTVTLTEKGKTIGSGVVTGGTGKVRITKKLKPGKHKVVATFAGSSTVLTSASSTLKFVVAGPAR